MLPKMLSLPQRMERRAGDFCGGDVELRDAVAGGVGDVGRVAVRDNVGGMVADSDSTHAAAGAVHQADGAGGGHAARVRDDHGVTAGRLIVVAVGLSSAPVADEQGLFVEAQAHAYVAFALPPVTREERASQAKPLISQHFEYKQKMFLDFVLGVYVSQGVEELDSDKLLPLLRLKYNNAIADAALDLGKPEQIRELFVGFQKYLYQESKTA